jgi:hypothetical protein
MMIFTAPTLAFRDKFLMRVFAWVCMGGAVWIFVKEGLLK